MANPINGLIEKAIGEVNDIVDALSEQNSDMNRALVWHEHFVMELKRVLTLAVENDDANGCNNGARMERWVLGEIAKLEEELDK